MYVTLSLVPVACGKMEKCLVHTVFRRVFDLPKGVRTPNYFHFFLCYGMYKKIFCYETKITESEKNWQSPGVKPRTHLA